VGRLKPAGGQRALAAQVLGYASDKRAVLDDLLGAMHDQSDEVHNNAMRALLVFADAAMNHARTLLERVALSTRAVRS
jgi:HEAT repeat protein